jgi:hypothetical protein
MGTRFFKTDDCVDYYDDDEISHALAVQDRLKKELDWFIKYCGKDCDWASITVRNLLQKILDGEKK